MHSDSWNGSSGVCTEISVKMSRNVQHTVCYSYDAISAMSLFHNNTSSFILRKEHGLVTVLFSCRNYGQRFCRKLLQNTGVEKPA